MPAITSFELLDEAIKNTGGRPTVLEALWDGDTDGWFLLLSLYFEIKEASAIKEESKHVGIVSYTGDSTLFSGEVPLWPEAALAREWGMQAADKYGLTFYFPSHKEPDNHCPAWDKRHLGIRCADCDKLIIPANSPHLPKEVCYHCLLRRESNEKIQKAAPIDDSMTMYLSIGDQYEYIRHCTPYINQYLPAQPPASGLTLVTLGQETIVQLKQQLEEALAPKLAAYTKPVVEEQRKPFYDLYTIDYKGQQYELMGRFNDDHSKIAYLIDCAESAEKAIAENGTYNILFRKGFTYRDDAIFRFLKFVSEGATTIAAINERYANILTAEEVWATLQKLQQFHCLAINGIAVRITEMGERVIV